MVEIPNVLLQFAVGIYFRDDRELRDQGFNFVPTISIYYGYPLEQCWK